MNRAVGIVFTLFAVSAALFAFSERPDPPMPSTRVDIGHLLMLDVQPAGDRLVSVGERGRIFVSDDAGASWRAAVSPTEATLTALAFIDARHGVAVGHDAAIVRTDDGGEHWQLVEAAPEDEEPLLALWFDSDGHGFAVGAYGRVAESRDGGLTWVHRDIDDQELHFNAITRVGDALLIAGEAGTMLRSDDDGATWGRLDAPYEGSYFGLLATGDGGVLAFGMRGHVFRSESAGARWQEIDSGTQASVFAGHVVGDDALVLAGQNGLVLASRDGGRSFVEVDAATSRSFAAVVAPRAGGELVLAGDAGVTRIGLAPQPAGKP